MTAETDRRVRRALGGDRSITVTRSFAVEDIRVRSGGDGHTVDAYAAVFMDPSEIVDQDGHYLEQNAPDAFNKSVAERMGQIFCVYNHARSLGGSPSDTWSVPLGKPLSIRADKRGLLTSTRYSTDPQSERILEAIKNGALTGMSYTGVFLRSDPELQAPYATYAPGENGVLPLVTRQEIALIEFGPTPIPAFESAVIVGVRNRRDRDLGPSSTSSNPDGPAPYVRDADETVQCPNCQLWNHTDANFCDQCGQALNATSGYGPDDDNAEGNVALQCPSCGKSNGSDAIFCDQCGASIPSSAYAAGVNGAIDAKTANSGMQSPKKSSSATDRAPDEDETERANTPAMPASDGDGDGKKKSSKKDAWDPDGDGDDDSTPEGDTNHSHWDKNGKQIKPVPGKPLDGKSVPPWDGKSAPAKATSSSGEDRSDDDTADRAGSEGEEELDEHLRLAALEGDNHFRAGIDNSSWDAQKVWTAGLASKSPASFFSATCAGKRSGDPKLAATWALPHHYHPGDGPNASGVSAALGRFAQTQGLTNSAAAKAHLEAHDRAIQTAKGSSSSDSGSSSSSGRQPAADDATSRAEAGGSTEPPGTGTSTAEPHAHPAPASKARSTKKMEDDRMTVAERIQRQADVRARLNEIDDEYMGSELPNERRQEWKSLQEELVIHERSINDALARQEYLRSIADGTAPVDGAVERVDDTTAGYADRAGGDMATGAAGRTMVRGGGVAGMRGKSPQFMARPDAVYDLTSIRNQARSIDEVPGLYREYASRAIDAARFPGVANREGAQGNVQRLVDSIDDEMGSLSRRILCTGSPLYERAFGKMLKALSINGLSMEESRALQLGVDASGGYAVPFQLDPTVILTYNGVINPLRQISRVEQITGKEWDGVTSTGIVVSRATEGQEASDNSPAFIAPTVRTTRVQGFVPFSLELDMSWGSMRNQLTQMLADAKDIEEATSFTLGNGTPPQCNGVVPTVYNTTASTVLTATTATLAVADIYNVEDQAAPKFRQTSSWLASKTTYNRIRQLFQQYAALAGDPWVRATPGQPSELLGYPAFEASVMSNAITSNSQIALFGDFSQFLIVDRVGMGIELVPHLFGALSRFPTGQRGLFAVWFNNSQVLAPNAFRELVVR